MYIINLDKLIDDERTKLVNLESEFTQLYINMEFGLDSVENRRKERTRLNTEIMKSESRLDFLRSLMSEATPS